MKLPFRKCYHAAKVGLFLIIVITILALYEQWRGGKRAARAESYDNVDKYEKEILEDEARIIPGLGEGGVAAHLVGEDKRLGEESEKKLAINVYLSDRIAYNRTIKDYRNPACQRVIYDAELPSASVILIFHNEPYSVVIRTIWSVVNSARRDNPWFAKAKFVDKESGRTVNLGYPGQDKSSPFVYLKEIILVDDNSTLPELKGKLSHYVRTRLPPDLIRILRLPDRVGVTQARLAGSRLACGDVMIFLDSHSEASIDWLRPILQRIKDSRTAVVTPIIDILDQALLEYKAGNIITFEVGGFTFVGHFTWIDVPEREKKRRGSDIAPTWSPTMAGGLFAINRQYYWELGAYDEQMAGWGGENLEMSFRIWQCGGTLETVPCSRVGHVFRSFHPYGLPAHTDTHGINTARMAEVWMDDYAELFYLHRPDLRKSPKIGDVTHRKVLREKLKCKSFQWYLDNIYKEKFVPVRDVFGFGRFRNPSSGTCLDSLQREGEAVALGLYPCQGRLEPTQHLALSLAGELRGEEKCAEVQYERSPLGAAENRFRRVLMVSCHGKQRGQHWRYLPTKQLQHTESRLCLQSTGVAGTDVVVARCKKGAAQVWVIDYSELNKFRMSVSVHSSQLPLYLRHSAASRVARRPATAAGTTDTNGHEHALHLSQDAKSPESTSGAASGAGAVMSSCADLFLFYKKCLAQCATLSTGEPMLELSCVFACHLRSYAGSVLSSALPRAAAPLPALVTGLHTLLRDDAPRYTKQEISKITSVITTSEYCLETTVHLEQKLKEKISPSLADKIDLASEQDLFHKMISNCIQLLVQDLELACEPALQAMTKISWLHFDNVGDQSSYVTQIIMHLKNTVPNLRDNLASSRKYFTQFCIRFANSFIPKFIQNIYKCKPISTVGSEQLLLDTHMLKTALLELPSIGSEVKRQAPTTYTKVVIKLMTKAEMILKLVMAPLDGNLEGFVAQFVQLLPESTLAEFHKVLDMKGAKLSKTQLSSLDALFKETTKTVK